MKEDKFSRAKIKRLVKFKGKSYIFTRANKNSLGEPSGTQTTVQISGIYHEVKGYTYRSATDGGLVRKEAEHLILCNDEDGKLVEQDDVVTIDGNEYEVTDVRNIANLECASDISLKKRL